MRVAASCVAWRGQAALLRGPSGSGKSDLCWRAILHSGADLVADDGVTIERQGNKIIAQPLLPGLIELRGVGVIQIDHVASAEVRLIVDLQVDMPRMAEPLYDQLLGVELPRMQLDALQAMAPYRLQIALQTIGRDGFMADGVYTWQRR